MQFAYSKTLRTLAAAVAGMAMLGAVVVTPQVANAQDFTVSDIGGLQDAVKKGGTVTLTDNINGWTGLGSLQPSTLTVSKNTTINGNGRSLQGVEVVVKDNAELTANNVFVDDARSAKNHWNEGVAPYDVQSGTLNIEGGAAISDNGNSKSITTIHVAKGATANINASTKTYYSAQNSGEKYSSIYGSDYAIKGDAGSTINIKGGNIADENNGSDDRGAVVSAGTVNFTGGRAQNVTVHQPGVLNLNGGTIDKDLQYEYDTNDKGTDAALTVDDNATVYLTKGTIKSDKESGVTSYPLNLSAQAKVYAQAAGQQDVTVDGTALYIAKANGNKDVFTTDPTVSAGYSNIPGAISGQKLYVNYGDVSTLPQLVTNESSSKEALNQVVVDQNKISSSYLGYHGNLNVYGKYTLNSTTLNQGRGTVTVYSVPAAADYEWYSAAEVKAKKQAGTYPDASSPDQSFEAAGYTGRKFAGWFKSGNEWKTSQNTDNIDVVNNDANYTTTESHNSTADGTVGQNKFAWAHFADAKNQNVAVQQSTDGTVLRFLTAVDTLKYRNVQFKIEWQYGSATTSPDKGEGTLNSDHVYTAVNNATPVAFTDQAFGTFNNVAQSNNGKGYFATALLRGIPSDYLGNAFFGPFKVTITPSWTTLDGTVVTGTPVTKNL